MISYILQRKYLYIKNSMCVWSWINFQEFPPLVIMIWACILRVGVLPHVTLLRVMSKSDFVVSCCDLVPVDFVHIRQQLC